MTAFIVSVAALLMAIAALVIAAGNWHRLSGRWLPVGEIDPSRLRGREGDGDG